MTTEIEKLYENAGIKGEWRDYRVKNGKIYVGKNPKNRNIRLCKPRFIAEKQLELIKLIANRKGYPDYEYFGELFDDYIQLLDFNEALAKLVNILWQDLTDAECTQIKEILK